MIKQCSKIVFFVSCILILTSCNLKPKKPYYPTAMEDIHASMAKSVQQNKEVNKKQKLPNYVSSALLPSLSIKSKTKASDDKRFNISVDNVQAQTFFMSLVENTKYSIVMSPKVHGQISLNLKDVTIPQVMQTVHDIYGYQYTQTGNSFQVMPNVLQSRIFTVNYLNVQRKGKSSTEIISGDLSQTTANNASSGATITEPNTSQTSVPSSSVDTTSESNFWATLKTTLTSLMGNQEGSEIIINPSAGLVVAKGYPKQLSEIGHYLEKIQSTMNRQVILEAKILEVVLDDGYQAGIDWNILGMKQDAASTVTEEGTNLISKAVPQFFTLSAAYKGAFSTVINMLSTQGNVQVLSSPRIATLNNQKALIKVGDDQFYVTNVSTNTISSSGGIDSGQNVNMRPFFSGIALDVTPQIDKDGKVMLHIHPMITRVTQTQLKVNLGTSNGEFEIPTAKSTVRESDSIVQAEDGQVIVIGGLMENETEEDLGSTPWLGDIPFFGALFRRTGQKSKKTELVILLRPIVVTNGVWDKRLKEHQTTFNSLNRGFHLGSHPATFGTEGEREPK